MRLRYCLIVDIKKVLPRACFERIPHFLFSPLHLDYTSCFTHPIHYILLLQLIHSNGTTTNVSAACCTIQHAVPEQPKQSTAQREAQPQPQQLLMDIRLLGLLFANGHLVSSQLYICKSFPLTSFLVVSHAGVLASSKLGSISLIRRLLMIGIDTERPRPATMVTRTPAELVAWYVSHYSARGLADWSLVLRVLLLDVYR
jgi:hypothetical protein